MNTFSDYIRQVKQGKVTAPEIVKKDNEFYIYDDGLPLLTPGRHPIKHHLERIIEMILSELILNNSIETGQFGFQTLFSFQKDVLENSNDSFTGKWNENFTKDSFVKLKTSGKSGVLGYPPDHELFNFSFSTISALVRTINNMFNKAIRDYPVAESEEYPFLEVLRYGYQDLSMEQKSVIQAISDIHQSGIVLPLMLVSGLINPTEYVNGILAMQFQGVNKAPMIISEVNRALDYLSCFKILDGAVKTLDQIISEGESEVLEFKSTLRWDIRGGKTNQVIERAALKTISAFLNSGGGTLLIGVRDDGSIEGIETDKFVNEDKFLLHLWTLIRTCLGRDVSPSIRSSLEKVEEKTVCIIRCIKNNRPVFLHQPGFPEEFYIRMGPASNAMDISEALKYIRDRFQSGIDLPMGS